MADTDIPQLGEVVQLPPLDHLHRSGVYFLWHKGEVVYVGQGKDMRTRIANHMADPLKTFDAVSGLPCREDKLLEAERHYIEKLVPKYNRCGVAKAARDRGMEPQANVAQPAAMDQNLTREQAIEFLGVDEVKFSELNASGLIYSRRERYSHRRLYRLFNLREVAAKINAA